MAMKQMVYRHQDMAFQPALIEADATATASLGNADAREGIAAFVERRKPRFGRLG